jgi:uncharacterized protein
MADRSVPNAEIDLGPLDDFLLSDRAPDNCMGLSDLDGFLTGVVVGPELIPSAEWLPIIWGGDEPEFVGVLAAETILGIIMARYNEIIAHLDVGPDSFDPVFWEGPDDLVIVTDWAAGFLDAVRLRANAWEPVIRDREARALMIPLLALGTEDHDHPPFGSSPLSTDEIEELLEHGAEIIPHCVAGLRAFWQNYRDRPPATETQSRR